MAIVAMILILHIKNGGLKGSNKKKSINKGSKMVCIPVLKYGFSFESYLCFIDLVYISVYFDMLGVI